MVVRSLFVLLIEFLYFFIMILEFWKRVYFVLVIYLFMFVNFDLKLWKNRLGCDFFWGDVVVFGGFGFWEVLDGKGLDVGREEI